MKLYHGTSYAKLDAILKDGLRPRGRGKGNWKETFVSRPDMVYLSVAYPFYFALNALPTGHKIAVFELDIESLIKEQLYPDEDFVAQAAQDLTNHSKYRNKLETYRTYWQKSLEGIGNVCYRGQIPRQAITRCCVIETQKRHNIAMMMADPIISLTNYRYCGEEYRKLVAWAFGDEPELPMVEKARQVADISPFGPKGVEIWLRESKNREGIEVLNAAI